jgi:hypothetical protein
MYASANLKPSVPSLRSYFVRSKRPVYTAVNTKPQILDNSNIKTQATNGRHKPRVTERRATLIEAQRRLTVLDAARHDVDRSETEGEDRPNWRINPAPHGE